MNSTPDRANAVLLGPDTAFAQPWLFRVAPIAGATIAGLVQTWLGAEDSPAYRGFVVQEAARPVGEALVPAPAREPR